MREQAVHDGPARPALNGLVLGVFAAVSLTGSVGCAATPRSGAAAQHRVAAVQFATLSNFPVRGLVLGADSSRRMDIAMMIWPIQMPNGHILLVDAGFVSTKFISQWKPRDYLTPDSALRRSGFDPTRVTDIILSHIHWDHADGIDRFPNARVWLQREEYDYYVGRDGEPLRPAIDSLVAARLHRRARAGLVRLLADSGEVYPGIRVHTGGKHTYASQFVSVRNVDGGTVVLASDNAYLYENLERERPIAQTLDSLSNLAAQKRMRAIASPQWVVPGHDPAVLRRFPATLPMMVEIRR